jgi:hypothetical protein
MCLCLRRCGRRLLLRRRLRRGGGGKNPLLNAGTLLPTSRSHDAQRRSRRHLVSLCRPVGRAGKAHLYEGASFRCYAAVQDLDSATELENTFGTYGVIASSEETNTGSAGRAMEAASRSRASNLSYHAGIMHDTRADELFVLARSTPPRRCGRATHFRRPELVAQVGSNRFYKGAAQ